MVFGPLEGDAKESGGRVEGVGAVQPAVGGVEAQVVRCQFEGGEEGFVGMDESGAVGFGFEREGGAFFGEGEIRGAGEAREKNSAGGEVFGGGVGGFVGGEAAETD